MSTHLNIAEDVPAPTGGTAGTDAPGGRGRGEVASEGRWDDRPLLAGALRGLSFLLPLVASLTAAWLLASALPTPATTGGQVMWWIGVAAASIVVLLAFDRLARRLLPLAALLKLSMVFPDRAPSRLGVALRSGSTKRLQERAVHDLQEGKQEPAAAASTILILAASLNAHDRGTRGHSERVRAYADLIAEEMSLGRAERDRLRWAALLHDLGKLSVPSSTLNAHEQLSEDDWATLRRHPLEGARLAAPLRDWLGTWATAIEQHHERFDGTGYPFGLSGEQLSLGARIVAVADSYDAMTSVRSYSAGITPAAARRELARKAGTDFDPTVVRAFLNVGLGRVRWVMGPLAFFSVLPFAPGFGGLRSAVTNTGRTVAMGTASLVVATTVVAPQLDVPSTPEPRVLSEKAARPAPGPNPAGLDVAPEAPLPEPAVEAVETVGTVPAADPVTPVAASAASGAPTSKGPTSRAPRSGAPASGAPTSGAPTSGAAAPPPASSPSSADPGPVPPGPAPANEEPAAAPVAPRPCPNAGKTDDHAPECAPRWGHTDERPPHGGGQGAG